MAGFDGGSGTSGANFGGPGAGCESAWFGGRAGAFQYVAGEIRPVEKTQGYAIDCMDCGAGEVLFGCADGSVGVLNV